MDSRTDSSPGYLEVPFWLQFSAARNSWKEFDQRLSEMIANLEAALAFPQVEGLAPLEVASAISCDEWGTSSVQMSQRAGYSPSTPSIW